jgi:hypothetical protein
LLDFGRLLRFGYGMSYMSHRFNLFNRSCNREAASKPL